MKKMFALLLAGCLVVGAVTGCGNSPAEGTGNNPSDEVSGTGADHGGAEEQPGGKIVVGGFPVGDEAFKAALEGFHAEYPDIEVEFQFLASGDYHQQLQTALAAGTGAPDVAMVEGAQIGLYRDAKVMENLLSAPYNAGELAGDFVDYKWNQALSVDGSELCGLVWDIGPSTYFYRADIFEEVGLPSEPEAVAELMSTYEGVLEVAEKVYIENQRWLLPNALYLYTWNFLNRNFYDENLNLLIDTENARKGLEAAITMRENGWDAQISSMWDNEANIGFANGSIVSIVAGSWYGGSLKSYVSPDNAGKWAVTTLPAGIPNANWGGSYVCIPKQSENKEAAWAFVKYMMADADAQNAMFEATDYFPGYMPAWDSDLYEAEDPYFGGQKVRKLWVEIANDIEPVFSTYMDGDVESIMVTAVDTGLSEGMNADQILEFLEQEIEDKVKQDFEKQVDIMKSAGLYEE